jgi:hypothetical protein
VLPPNEFRGFTRRFWAILFFGARGKTGIIPRRLESITSEQERMLFVQALMSPRLTAALALWCCPEWQMHDSRRETGVETRRISAGFLFSPWQLTH